MNSANKENINRKRKRTESFDGNNFSNENTVSKKMLKSDKNNNAFEDEIYFDNNITGSESMKILANSDINTSVKTSNFIGSLNKNDVLTLIWKTNFDYFALVEKSKKIIQHYMSKRGDLWEFTIFYDKQTHNIIFRIKVNEKYSENQQSKYSECYGLEFTADLTMQVNSPIYRSISVNNNAIPFGKENDFSLDFIEDISDELINNNSEINLIFEISITKNYLNLINNERKKIGYIGMINEAMTCYMNSMIQTLNIFGAFKKAVFDIPTKEDDYNSISLSLQRLFYDLMLKETPVSTDKLIMSFGWGREEMNMQHDVQEFNLLLGELMEKKMKGTPGEGTFSRLFEGKLINYIECFNVDYKSEKEERFTDLQLTVKGCKNIYQSFDKYISEDILDNDDKYFAEGYGKQKAKKGIKFLKCPNILILQLKRFEYNQKREAMVKINEYFEFYEELNLEKYMYTKPNQAQDSNENLYSLHSVVVHKGSPNSGHYYAYIKPTIEDNWIQFNDEVVKPADKYEVFDNNFGGTNKYFKLKAKAEISETNYSFESNAYILVYVKKTMRRSILYPLRIENVIPKKIKERFDNDLMNEIKEQIKRKRVSENIMLQIFSPEVIKFFDNIGINKSFLDLGVDKPLFLDYRRIFKINVPRFFTFADLLNFISKQTNIPINEFIIFEYSAYQKDNLIKRGDFTLKQINPEDYGSLIEIYTKNHKQQFPVLFLYTKKNWNIFKPMPPIIKGAENNEASAVEDYQVTSSKNTANGVIYIPSVMNLLELNGGAQELNFANEDNQIISFNGQTMKLIFLKLFLPNNLMQYLDLIGENYANENNNKIQNYSENYSLRIIEIFDFNYNKEDPNPIIITNLKAVVLKKLNDFLLNVKLNPQLSEYFNNLKAHLEIKEDFSFITERTCLSDYPSERLYEEISGDNVKEVLEKNDGIILIPTAPEEDNTLDQTFNILNSLTIKRELESYYNKLFIDLFCLSTSLPLYDKMEFNIKEITDERIIKQKILEKIKQEKLFNLIFILQNHFIITSNQETISAQNFIEKIDLSYFEIVNNRDNNGKTINMYKEIPIAKYVNYAEMRIDLSFSYIPKASLSEFKNFEVTLFDKDSNKIAFLSCVLPRKIKRSKEIVEFIAKSARINTVFEDYNNDLFRSNNSQSINKLNVNNSFFILQHPRDNFIFHFITDENTDVFKFEGKAEFKFRVQMYDDVFMEKIHNPVYTKVYVKVNVFSNSKVKVDPLILYLEKIQTNFELKLEVFKSLENNRNLNKALSPNYSNVQEFLQNEMNIEKIKFFKFSVSGGKSKKSTNLSAFKDDDYVDTIFKGERICNLLVEIALNNLSA